MPSLLHRPSSCAGCNTLIHIVATAISFLLFLMFWWQQKRLCPSCPSPRVHCSQERWYLIYSGACRKDATSSRKARKPRIGEQAGWESTGPGQNGVRHGLAIKKNLYKQPPGNTSPASLGSKRKHDRATTGL